MKTHFKKLSICVCVCIFALVFFFSAKQKSEASASSNTPQKIANETSQNIPKDSTSAKAIEFVDSQPSPVQNTLENSAEPFVPLTNDQYVASDPYKDAIQSIETRKLNLDTAALIAAIKQTQKPQTINLNLFGKNESFTFDSLEETDPKNGGISGQMPTSPDSIVTLGYSGSGIALSIQDPNNNRYINILEVGDGTQRVIQYALSGMHLGCETCGSATPHEHPISR